MSETFQQRLEELIGEESIHAFGKRAGINDTSMRAYLKDTMPGLDKLVAIAETGGVTLDWLARGIGPKRVDSGVDGVINTPDGRALMIQAKRTAPDGFALVPRLDIQASAGNGRLATTEEPLDYLAFQADWLRGRGINPAFARILTAKGDSMEETIRDGDVLLVDTSIDRVRDNSIYVVVYGDMVLVKRIHGRINGSLQLISDNPRYPPEEVAPGEVDQLNIAGRVMWFGRSI
ncbi:helix-turn-helix transcriptional regulator [Rhizobium sp. FKY42]|uniref:helix-turn-helix transcriptional regulator n=1 Tax=Rhizobium sp. FKY42 TaxID=2562310 RepID=UPI001FEFEFAD|nr:helix-turn-helix transcriptional regulator [Rhizobium sp. FKY42]